MLFHAIAAGMTTARPRMCATVPTPITRPDASITAPPANPSCSGAVTRMTCSSSRPRPVRNGPPMTATMPALAVSALLHDRATASAM